MSLKLRKKIENEKMYYLVSDANKNDTYYEFYQFDHYKEIPNIENIYYKIMGSELVKAYDSKPFSSVGFKSILLLSHGIIIDGNVINIGTANILYDLVQNIRFKDLYNVINSFRKHLSIKVLNYFRDKILEIEINQLSKDTQEFFNELIETLNYKKDTKEFFREIMYLAIINEYQRAYNVVYEAQVRTDKYIEEYDE